MSYKLPLWTIYYKTQTRLSLFAITYIKIYHLLKLSTAHGKTWRYLFYLYRSQLHALVAMVTHLISEAAACPVEEVGRRHSRYPRLPHRVHLQLPKSTVRSKIFTYIYILFKSQWTRVFALAFSFDPELSKVKVKTWPWLQWSRRSCTQLYKVSEKHRFPLQ